MKSNSADCAMRKHAGNKRNPINNGFCRWRLT
jgi:hypothetical protein